MDKLEDFDVEMKSFKDLSHPGIVKMYDSSHFSTMVRQNEFPAEIKVCYLVFELICGGELFEYILKPPTFSEPVVRTIFQQILSALSYCHGKGLAHRDLKLENVLLDEQFQVRIADFGTAKIVDKNNQLKTTTGTAGYMAPEVASSGPYNAFLADVFSLGCVLFMLATRMPVTEGECNSKDANFKYMMQGRPDKFWKNREKIAQRYQVDFKMSANLKSLLLDMLVCDPSKRINLDQVINHPWMSEGPIVNQQEMIKEFSDRLGQIDPVMEAARSERARRAGRVYMGGEEHSPEMKTDKIKDQVELPNMGYKRLNVLYSEAHPVLLMQLIQEHLEHENVTPIINEDNWSVSYQQPMKNLEYDDESKAEIETEIKLNVQIDFQKFNSDRVALVFSTKDSGYAKWLLTEHFQQIAAENTAWGYQMTETEESAVERTNIRAELEAGI